LELLSLPFLVLANLTICFHSIVLVGLLFVLNFVQLSSLLLVGWVLTWLDILSPQCILACGSLVGSSHRRILAFLVDLALVFVGSAAGRPNFGGCCFGSVASFVDLFGFLLCHLVSLILGAGWPLF